MENRVIDLIFSEPVLQLVTMKAPTQIQSRLSSSFRRGGLYRDGNAKVVINVGGKRFETKHSTLKNIPDTRLGSLDENSEFYDAITKEYFFDRNPQLFDSILNYFRTGQLHFPHCHCGPVIKLELDFWGIDENSLSACCWESFRMFENEKKTMEDLKQTLDFNMDLDENKPVLTEDDPTDKGCYERMKSALWQFLDKPQSSRPAKVWNIIMLIFIMMSIVVVALESDPLFRVTAQHQYQWVAATNITNPKLLLYYDTDPHQALWWIEAVCTVLFSIELTLRFFCAPSKSRFFASFLNIIDIISIIPLLVVFIITSCYDQHFFLVTGSIQFIIMYLGLSSSLRILRLFKLAKCYRGLKLLLLAIKSSLRELSLLFLMIIMGMLLFSTIIYYVEFVEEEKIQFPSIPLGFYWSIITMTTVGYGDIVAATFGGKFISCLCAICGMLITGLPIPIIASKLNYLQKFDNFAQSLMERKLPKANIWKNSALEMHNNSTEGAVPMPLNRLPRSSNRQHRQQQPKRQQSYRVHVEDVESGADNFNSSNGGESSGNDTYREEHKNITVKSVNFSRTKKRTVSKFTTITSAKRERLTTTAKRVSSVPNSGIGKKSSSNLRSAQSASRVSRIGSSASRKIVPLSQVQGLVLNESFSDEDALCTV